MSPTPTTGTRSSRQTKAYSVSTTCAVIMAGLFSTSFFVTSLYISAHRYLWYDEIVTYVVSSHSPGEILRILRMGIDQQPLPYYLLVRFSEQVFGMNNLSLRIPSAVGLFVGLLVTFDCARRLTDGLNGLLALVLLTCTILPYYGAEARPYTLFFMWTACSLWLWLHTQRGSRIAALWFGLTVFAAVTSHYYAVLCLIPFSLSTLLDIRTGGLPPKLITGGAGAVAGLAMILPGIHVLPGLRAGNWAAPSLAGLDEIFVQLFPHALILLSLTLIWIIICSPRQLNVAVLPMSGSERLAWLFLLIPFAGFVAAKFVTNALYSRYFMGMLAGVAVGFSCIIWRHFRSRPIVPLGILCLLAGVTMARYAPRVRSPEWVDPPTAPGLAAVLHTLLNMEDTLLRDGKQFVVVPADSLVAIEVLYNSPHPERYRLFQDPNVLPAIRVNGGLGVSLPMHLWNANDVKNHAREAALINFGDFAMQRLGLAFQVRPSPTDSLRVIYLQ